MTAYVIEADGGSRGNPGPAGYGAVVRSASDDQVLAEVAEPIGTATNNVAEYRGLIAGLTALLALAGDGAAVEVRMDSKLVIEQMAGRWKVKHEGLRPLAAEAAALARRLRVTWTWVPREHNRHADRLANQAMDSAATGAAPPRPAPPPEEAAQPTLFPSGELPESGVEEPRPRRGTGWRADDTRSATTLLLLRHGETPLSAERRFSGLGDPELTPQGVAQAEAAAARLARKPYEIDVIVTSPLRRARATAEAVAAKTGLPVQVDEGFREVDFGAWEGHTFTEIQRRWPRELAAWLADPDAAPPTGESFSTTARRVEDARERLIGEHPGKTILVVSHVTPIKTLLRLALLAPPAAMYRMHLDLACLSQIDYYSDGPCVVTSFNDTAHLR
ncbi:putative phosphoglycerate mutase [Thermocatellispora tengchongensis]|uniref:Putative phosphoglycerate mutase n=1 Tax=Thermocatellispora tengchongensis TaxID=1073253 RepID=A0A840PH24_9ACTN|nr:bifunctional RNase H/acid phosphatase [Thermocatellispora tengchongensis]MBB5135335.1 putative phosphoglycerate mutase [Thermocatellispora tengchongensis]